MKELTDDIVITSYEIIDSDWKRKALMGNVAMDEIFKHIRKHIIKNLTILQFKEFMKGFYNRRSTNDFEFGRATILRAEVRRYGFEIEEVVGLYRNGGMYYYMRKNIHH